jgi:uncharacterized membrane protein YhaH (DUF805 family)
MFLGTRNGVLVFTPVVLVGIVGLVRFRDHVPSWAKSAALAALGYLLVHAAFNRASGGMPLFYRYPLEPLALAAVALTVGAKRLYDSGKPGRVAILVSAILSVELQFMNVFYMSCLTVSPNTAACFAF